LILRPVPHSEYVANAAIIILGRGDASYVRKKSRNFASAKPSPLFGAPPPAAVEFIDSALNTTRKMRNSATSA
jgi:hypothetical protein